MAANPTLIKEARAQSESIGSVALTAALLLFLCAWMVGFSDRWVDDWATSWPAFVFWICIVLLIDFFPIRVGSLLLTLDVPVLLAVALLYTPEVAASIACLAALDLREVRGGVRIGRAVFNRAQIAVSVLVAGHVLDLFVTDVARIQSVILPMLAALLADYAVNATLVTAIRVVDGSATSFMEELWRLKVGSWWEFFGTYFAYGLLAILFARLYVDAGEWPVTILLVSALVARQALMRSRQLERLGNDLAKHQQLLMSALDRVVEERRDERLLIGGQLHDDVLQSIIRARMGIGSLTHHLADRLPDGAQELREADQAVQAAHDGLRSVIRGLRKSPLGSQGLLAALVNMAKDLRQEWRVRIDVDIPQELVLPPSHEVALYQAAREAVLNALKHSRATHVHVLLNQWGDRAAIEVTDDGVGISPDDLLDDQQHFGLALLRERVGALGGSVCIESKKGRGTRVSVSLPLARS